ncbi:undecaprenyl-diphosphatase [Micromonospora pallida]|uniref:Undecaprenyl-diphosphatase n=1 Tax=Micromonospora pallida TaxID=145854 RepID=A0A1C6SZZ9_9ACTN|nr:phosphatase PAP2 family protein [Micromonospora pallida]SCL35144.1 undecaprenyl-diphosphatase [Micromonospora pallida]
MSTTTFISFAIALIAVAVAFGLVICARPAVRRLRARVGRGRLSLWLDENPTAQGLLVLLVGSATAFALILVFIEILDEVLDNDDLTVVDRPIIEWIADRRTAGVDTVVVLVTDIGGKVLLASVLAIAASAVALRLRSWRPVVLAAIAGGGGALLVAGIKVLIGRDRPDPLHRAVFESGFSFPSGHTASTLVILGTVALLISMVTASGTLRATAWMAAGILAVAVGLSRVYLGVHYPSDVLAGWVLGACWLVTVAIAARLPETAILPVARRLPAPGRVAGTALRPVVASTLAALSALAAIFGAVSIAAIT